MRRLISRVNTVGAERDDSDQGADPASLGDIDENDPRSMGRWMRRMGAESGEDLGPEFNDIVGRLEAGQDPEQIERDLPDIAGDGMGDAGESALD